MLGQPLYKENDMVYFQINYTTDKDNNVIDAGTKLYGKIYIVDAYGTFFYENDVCYDIYVEEENILYKHIPQTQCWKEVIESDK